MLMSERKAEIIKMFEQQSSVSVVELSNYYNVSEVTIRRDLRELDKKGYVVRIHGGAISVKMGATFEPRQSEKEQKNIYEKKNIAKNAYKMISEGETIFLDAGSTTLQLVRLLKSKKKKDLTIITNAFNIARQVIYEQL